MTNFEKKENYLLITGEGERKDLLTLAEGAKKVYAFIEETQSRLVLVDYRKVNLSILNVDAFNFVRFYESKLPKLTSVAGAVVMNEGNMALGNFWRDLANSRGYNFQVFTDFTEAEQWLLQQ